MGEDKRTVEEFLRDELEERFEYLFFNGHEAYKEKYGVKHTDPGLVE